MNSVIHIIHLTIDSSNLSLQIVKKASGDSDTEDGRRTVTEQTNNHLSEATLQQRAAQEFGPNEIKCIRSTVCWS